MTTYLLVHGAWHEAWCWEKVITLMQKQGYNVVAVDLPGHGKNTLDPTIVTLADEVQKVIEIARQQVGRVILVGHSSGGIVISQAAQQLGPEMVESLIYVDAFLPRNGDSVFSLVEMIFNQLSPTDFPAHTINEAIIVSEDGKTSVFKPEMAESFFYHDCSKEDVEFAINNLSRQSFASLGTPVSLSDEVYGTIPKFYILCTESRDLNKRFLTDYVRCKKVFSIPSSHSPFFSMPEKLVEIMTTYDN